VYSDSMLGVSTRIGVKRVGEERKQRTRNNAVCAIYNSRMAQKTLHWRSQIAYTRNAQNTVGIQLSTGIDGE